MSDNIDIPCEMCGRYGCDPKHHAPSGVSSANDANVTYAANVRIRNGPHLTQPKCDCGDGCAAAYSEWQIMQKGAEIMKRDVTIRRLAREGSDARGELDEALATIKRVKALAQKWTDDFMNRHTTHDDRDDRADARDDCAMDIRAALEACGLS